MIFNSLEFLIFLPIVFLLYWFVFKSRKQQNLLLVAASYLFYGWWDWKFLSLIAITTLLSYASGLLIDKYREQYGKAISTANVILNLGILGIFKYYNFFAENLQMLFHEMGYDIGYVTAHIILPIGISFYTFQALSYSIDVYRGRIKPCTDIISFFAYISFFPQLVAGPIERATQLLPQFHTIRQFDYAQVVDGCRQMLWGFFKKMVIADKCAFIVNDIWADCGNQSSLTLLLGAVFFTFQIYGDFSGYSDIAIGTARLFGINLMRNFNFPYFSRDIAEFWRRWHISLTTWFRDYLYIPLGGSRNGKWIAFRNTVIIFLISGFWHGANWTFVVWGAYHAVLFLPLMFVNANRKHTNTVAIGRLLPNIKEGFQMLLTFALVVIGWIIFRAENIAQAYDYILRMCSCTPVSWGDITQYLTTILPLGAFVLVEWLQREKQHALQISHKGIFKFRITRITLYYALILFTLVFRGFASNFIYFQF